MSVVKKCDLCRNTFDYGFLVDVNIQGGIGFINVAEDRFEIRKMDICKDCYYKSKKIIDDNIKSAANATNGENGG